MVGILQTGPARSPSLHDIELSDAVLILGEDVTNSAPRMALSLRQSVRQQPFEIAQKAAHSFVDGRRGARSGAGPKRALYSSRRRAPRGWMMSPPEPTAQRRMTWRGWASLSLMRLTRRRREFRDLPEEMQELARDHRRRTEEREAAGGDFRRQLPQRVRDRMRGERSQGFVR